MSKGNNTNSDQKNAPAQWAQIMCEIVVMVVV